jgi:O-antigen/teichoic acid export membrane protein
MAFLDYGVWSLVAQSLIHATVSNALLYIMEKWRPRLYFSWQALRELWGFGMRMFLSGVLETVFKNLDALIIGKLFLPATLGYYHRAKSLNNIVVDNASGSLMRIFLPTLSSVQNDKQRVLNIVDKSYHLITMIAFFITGFLFVTGRDIIILMFSDKWEPSVPLFRLIVLSAYAYPISAILVNILVALGNSKAFLRLEIIKKIVLLANFIIGFHFGIHEFLIGFVIANAISVLLNIYFASKQIEVSMRWFIFRSMPYVLITLFSAASAYFIFIKWDDVFVLHGLASGILYIAMFIAGLFLTQTKGLKLIKEEIHNHNIKKWFKK